MRWLILHDYDLAGVRSGVEFLVNSGLGEVREGLGGSNWRSSGGPEGVLIELTRDSVETPCSGCSSCGTGRPQWSWGGTARRVERLQWSWGGSIMIMDQVIVSS